MTDLEKSKNIRRLKITPTVIPRSQHIISRTKINDNALKVGEDKYIQIVSCNTHNLSTIINTLVLDEGDDNLVEGDTHRDGSMSIYVHDEQGNMVEKITYKDVNESKNK